MKNNNNEFWTPEEKKMLEEMAEANKAPQALKGVMNSIFDAVRIKQNFLADSEFIWGEPKFTSEYRAQQVAELKEKAEADLKALREKITKNVGILAAKVEVDRPKLDLTNANFQTALSLINATGGDMDVSTQKEIVGMFNGNAAMLKALLPVFKKHNMNIAEMAADSELARINRAEAFPGAVTEFAAVFTAALDNYGGATEIYSNMRTFASVYGMDAPEMPKDVMVFMMRSAAGVL